MKQVKPKSSTDGKIKEYLKALGPGLITGAADDDPSGIGTYSIAGAQLGSALLWLAWLTWPLMAAVQMMCARIGMVTGEGLASAFKKKFPKSVLIVICFSLVIANILNVGADLAAMADAAAMLTGLNSHFFVILFAIVISLATVFWKYPEIARVLKWLSVFLFAYVIAAFYLGPNWKTVLHDSFIPSVPHTPGAWATVVAILGTTISPYLFFWQSSLEVEEAKACGKKTILQRTTTTPREIYLRKLDVGTGTLFSNAVMFFIILTTALTLHKHGVTDLETSQQVARALEPLAGHFAYLLYTFGILGVGFLAIPTLTGSAAYALTDTFSWNQGLNEKWRKARAFYAVIIISTLVAVALDFSSINPVKALYWSAVINGLLAPFLLVGILIIAVDKKIMFGNTSSTLSRITVGLTILMMFGAAIAMFIV